MTYVDNTGSHAVGMVAFVPSLASYSNGNLVSGAQNVELYPVQNTSLGQKETPAVQQINWNKMTVQNPSGGVIICFQSGGSNQYGVITIGGNGGTTTTSLAIYNVGDSGANGVCT